ncbi:MAG: hypothetical protein WBV69_13725 [Candidatus Sulfotelmatobacter sp.]
MIELRSMAVAMPEVVGHPNRTGFRGVLTMVDVPSQRAPSGARGHLVVLTRKAAEAALPSLLGMGVDYSPSLDRHDVRRKVGVITRAEVVGRNLELGGYLFAKDFPEIVEEIAKSGNGGSQRRIDTARESTGKTYSLHGAAGHLNVNRDIDGRHLRASLRTAAKRILRLTQSFGTKSVQRYAAQNRPIIWAEAGVTAPSKGLGMSYEVTDVHLTDTRAAVWILEKVTFTGAAILHREKAAYRDTWIELGI